VRTREPVIPKLFSPSELLGPGGRALVSRAIQPAALRVAFAFGVALGLRVLLGFQLIVGFQLVNSLRLGIGVVDA
jgi:hypothetical protein